MARVSIRGAMLRYEVLGDGPALVMTPGMRNGMDSMRPMAERLAEHYRVIIYDRRNTGGSDIELGSATSEQAMWAADLFELLRALDAVPAIVLGVSLGAGVSLAMTLEHPDAVRGLILAWIAGGEFPRDRLARELYGQFIAAAEAGGMLAVADSDFFRARAAENPAVRTNLLAWDRDRFIEQMRAWDRAFRAPNLIPPVSRDTLAHARLATPVLTIAGDDEIHLESAAREVHDLLPASQYHAPMLTRAEWESLGAPSPPGHPDRHRAIAAYRGVHVPPVVREFLERRL
jgi:pimeloyl-ACP methyl ester carboxylesterase